MAALCAFQPPQHPLHTKTCFATQVCDTKMESWQANCERTVGLHHQHKYHFFCSLCTSPPVAAYCSLLDALAQPEPLTQALPWHAGSQNGSPLRHFQQNTPSSSANALQPWQQCAAAGQQGYWGAARPRATAPKGPQRPAGGCCTARPGLDLLHRHSCRCQTRLSVYSKWCTLSSRHCSAVFAQPELDFQP